MDDIMHGRMFEEERSATQKFGINKSSKHYFRSLESLLNYGYSWRKVSDDQQRKIMQMND